MPINEDNRRKLIDFPEGKILEIKEDCVVGGHYHQIKTEYFILSKGSCLMILDNMKVPMRIGELYTVPPFTTHSFQIKKGSILIGLCSHPYDPNDEYKTPTND